MILCECGCGEPAGFSQNRQARFARGHGIRVPLAERFWSKVDRRGPDECWEWNGSMLHGGYGQINVGGRMKRAHRVSWELKNGTLPEDTSRSAQGTLVLHRCDNRACVNPSHLFLGTHTENMRDMSAKGRTASHPKLNAFAVAAIRDLATNAGVSQLWLSRLFGVSSSTISRVVSGENWAKGGT